MRVVLGDLKGAVDALPLENSLPSFATQLTTNNVVMGTYLKGNPFYLRLMTPGSSSLLFQDSPTLSTYCIIFWDVIDIFFFLCAILSYISFHLACFCIDMNYSCMLTIGLPTKKDVPLMTGVWNRDCSCNMVQFVV